MIRGSRGPPDAMGQDRSFSIVIPTYRRPQQLAKCLRSLANLAYPRHSFEVIVVDDDGGRGQTAAVVEAFQGELDVTWLAQSHAGPAAARNTGAARANGTFLAFTDDDCLPDPAWLTGLAAPLTKMANSAVGGRTVNALPENPFSSTSQMIIDFVYAHYNANLNEARFFASNNLAMPAALFRTAGGFDATLTTSEDRDLCDRWLYLGHSMVYAPEAVVHHAHPLTLRTFCRQHFNYGRGACRFYQIRNRVRQQNTSLQAGGFYLGMLRYPSLRTRGRHALLLTALTLLSQGASAAGLLWERASQLGRGRPHTS